MTAMATATFPDGTTPEVHDVALLAANLFTGGQETTVRLLSFALRIIAERADVQQRLRDDRTLIPNFIEETLRYESPLRSQFRMRSEEHTSELQSLMRSSYAVFCLKKKKQTCQT